MSEVPITVAKKREGCGLPFVTRTRGAAENSNGPPVLIRARNAIMATTIKKTIKKRKKEKGNGKGKEKLELSSIIPPVIAPRDFEVFPTFRETFLELVTDPDANATMRGFGRLLLEFVLAASNEWPFQPEGAFRAELRAALADLRHVQGYLLMRTGEAFGPRTPHEKFLANLGNEIARELGGLADRLEAELGSFRGEV